MRISNGKVNYSLVDNSGEKVCTDQVPKRLIAYDGVDDSDDAKRRKTSEADEDSELEEGEWVEVTKETIEQKHEQEKKQGKY